LSSFTCDASLVVTGCHDGIIKVWPNDAATLKSVTVRDAHDLGITCGDCSPVVGMYTSLFVVMKQPDSVQSTK
jgi:WD40 repeat protein